MEQLLRDALACGRQVVHKGKTADYIPALAKADGNQLGIAVVTTDNQTFCCGNCTERFTVQSIGKVMVLALALSQTPLGATGIWCAWPIGWGVATALSVLFYRASAAREFAPKLS